MNKKETRYPAGVNLFGMVGTGITTLAITPHLALAGVKQPPVHGLQDVPKNQDITKKWVPFRIAGSGLVLLVADLLKLLFP